MKQTFSLVLGGGAARWLAHIGVIEQLEKIWVAPVEISGTSIGAVIGAFYAAGYTSKDMKKIVQEVNLLSLVDLDLKNWLLKWAKISKFLWKYLGDMQFSELKIPLSIVSTDIDTGEKIVFREGRVVDAIRASIGIPWVFIPFKYNGKHLVDGGIMENLPIWVIQSDGPVIAVSVQIDIKKRIRVKKSFLFPDGTMLSNSYGVLRKMVGIMMTQNEIRSIERRWTVVLIRPERDDIDYYDCKKMNLMIAEWYRSAAPLVEYFNS